MTAGPDAFLPAVRDGGDGALTLRRLPGLGQDFLRAAGEARDAVRQVSGDAEDDDAADDSADCETMAWAGWLTRGDTQAAALRQLLRLLDASPGTLVTFLQLTRIPGPAAGTWEWAVCAATESPDPLTGEVSSPVHHTDRHGRVTHE